MKKVLLSVVLAMLTLAVSAQSTEVQARAAFLKAQELYGNGDFAGAIERLENAKSLLGSSNPRIDHLLANSHWEEGDLVGAKSALTSYFKNAKESDPNYNTMLLLLADVDGAIASGAKKAEARASGKQIVYNLDEGTSFKVVTEMKNREGQLDYTIRMENNYKVLSVGNQYAIKNTFEDVSLTPNGDSMMKGMLDNIGEYMGLFVGKSYDFTLSPLGQITVSSNSAAMRDQIGLEIDGLKMMKMYKKSFKTTRLDWEFNPQYLAATLNYTFIQLPEVLEQGTVWEMSVVLPNPKMEGTKMVIKMAPAIMLITAEEVGETTVSVSMKYKDEPVIDMHYLKGQMTIEKATGLPIEGTINRRSPAANSEMTSTFTRK